MKAPNVNADLSKRLAAELNAPRSQCYFTALVVALTLADRYHYNRADLSYCEGWAISEATEADGRTAYVLVGHGWVEAAGEIVDVAGQAVAYYPATRRTLAQMAPDTTELPCHCYDRHAYQRHTKAMQRAIQDALTLSPTWAAMQFLPST